VIPTRHSHVACHKLRQERQVEAYEDHQGRESTPTFRIHAAADLGPPVMQTTEIAHQCAAHHDVVEVRHHEIGIAQVYVDSERCQEQPGHTADCKQSDNPEGIEHRCIVGD